MTRKNLVNIYFSGTGRSTKHTISYYKIIIFLFNILLSVIGNLLISLLHMLVADIKVILNNYYVHYVGIIV